MALQHRYNGKTKFIIVTGGVISGLGKGVAAASIGALLSARMKVVPVKCDGYLNTDPGTMNPTEHGEVFVLDDGGECDMDFGHYERFLNVTAKKDWQPRQQDTDADRPWPHTYDGGKPERLWHRNGWRETCKR